MIPLLFSLIDSPRSMIVMIVSHVLSGAFQGLVPALLVPSLSPFFDSGRVETRWPIMELPVIGASMALPMVDSVTAFRAASFDICGDLIHKVGSRVQVLPPGWFDTNSAGRMMMATSTNISLLFHLPSIIVPKLASITEVAFTLLPAALVYDQKMALAIATHTPLCIITLHFLTRSVVYRHATEEAAMQDPSTRILGFVRLQAILRTTDCLKDGWGPSNQDFVREHETTQRVSQAKDPTASPSHASVVASLPLTMGVAAFQILSDVLEPGMFIALSLVAVRFAEPIGMPVSYIDPLHEVYVALGDIASIVHAPLLLGVDESQALAPADSFDLESNHVDLAYADDIPITTDFDRTLPGRSITALVDPSGSGKSTLVRLIAYFRDMGSDAIRLGEPDVREISSEVLTRRVSTVFQKVYLFSTSIEGNVRIGCLTANDTGLVETAERVGPNEIVERLPERRETIVREGGSTLSGGKRQRAAVARAFLKDSSIPLLDETTSALDGVNEASMTFALAELSTGRPVVVIAHRLSTARRADRILVSRDGAVEALDSHEELYEAGGTYRELWSDRSHAERQRIRSEEPRAPL